MFNIFCQSSFTISFQSKNNEPISDNVVLINNQDYYSSDKNGKIYLRAKMPLIIKASALGYASIDTLIENAVTNQIIIKMNFINDLREVVIKADALINRSISKNVITAEEIKRTIPLLGEKDPLKTLQMQPGVVFAQEGTSSIFVRGGNPGENLILLDNIGLYNTNHFFGMVSSINPDIIHTMDFYKGGFPAQYSDKASSVIDIKTNTTIGENKVKVGVLSSSAYYNKSILNDKIKLIGSIRTSPLSLGLKLYNNLINRNNNIKTFFNTHFYDTYFKLQYDVSKNISIYYSRFFGYDQIVYNSESLVPPSKDSTILSWSNGFHTLGIKSSVNTVLQNETNFFLSNYRLNNTDSIISLISQNGESYRYKNEITELGLKTKFSYSLIKNTKFNFGGSLINQYFNNFGNSLVSRNAIVSNRVFSDFEYTQPIFNAFLSFNGFLFGDKIKYDIGINRLANLKLKTSFLEPRVNTSFNFRRLSILYSFHRVSQNTNLITPESIGIPLQSWFPLDNKGNFLVSHQNNVGFIFRKNNLEFSIDGYIKKSKNVNYPGQGQDLRLVDPFTSELIRNGIMNSRGIELLTKGFFKKFTLHLAYTLSKSTLVFQEYNRGNKFLQNTDRTHNFNISLTRKLNKNWEFNTTSVLQSSYPITIPTSYFPSLSYRTFSTRSKFLRTDLLLIDFHSARVNNSLLFDLETVNNGRSLNYFRLDLSMKKSNFKNSELSSEFSFGFYNMTARRNPFVTIISDNRNGSAQKKLELSTYSLFNLIPFVLYEKYF
jgi:hypothetical protein